MGEAVAIGSPTGIYSAEIIKNIKKIFKKCKCAHPEFFNNPPLIGKDLSIYVGFVLTDCYPKYMGLDVLKT